MSLVGTSPLEPFCVGEPWFSKPHAGAKGKSHVTCPHSERRDWGRWCPLRTSAEMETACRETLRIHCVQRASVQPAAAKRRWHSQKGRALEPPSSGTHVPALNIIQCAFQVGREQRITWPFPPFLVDNFFFYLKIFNWHIKIVPSLGYRVMFSTCIYGIIYNQNKHIYLGKHRIFLMIKLFKIILVLCCLEKYIVQRPYL